MAAVAMSPPDDMEVDIEHKPTLTPPASEEADKQYDSGSELSELELEPEDKPEDDEEIEPDHYYDGGKIPVFKPVSTALDSPSTSGVDLQRLGYVTVFGLRIKANMCSVDRRWTSFGASSPSSTRSTSMV